MQEFDLPTAQVYTPEIRFVDIDAAGIVNNATYFNYFEQSRIAFFEPLLGKKMGLERRRDGGSSA